MAANVYNVSLCALRAAVPYSLLWGADCKDAHANIAVHLVKSNMKEITCVF